MAEFYGGKVSPSSGAADNDSGDVRNRALLIECKVTGEPTKPAKSASLKLADMEKIADEAWAESRAPMMSLWVYSPDSVLADSDGYVKLIARLQTDDYHYQESP